MFVMQLTTPGGGLEPATRPDPEPGPGEVRLRVQACGVCRTDLHVVDGDLVPQRSPIVPGHEVVGVVDRVGPGVEGVRIGERRGAPWLGGTCGTCAYCQEGAENLCDAPQFNGWTRDGGFADTVIHHEVLGPPDIEERIGLTGGNIFQGEVTPDQMWEGRLSARTPVPGFYLCGAATHPAGSVIATNGKNAAMAVLADAEADEG